MCRACRAQDHVSRLLLSFNGEYAAQVDGNAGENANGSDNAPKLLRTEQILRLPDDMRQEDEYAECQGPSALSASCPVFLVLDSVVCLDVYVGLPLSSLSAVWDPLVDIDLDLDLWLDTQCLILIIHRILLQLMCGTLGAFLGT
ncbi:hypothetical protein D9619_011741 [Psilocybe cf. subviscida]|uniref:Uncharacterized protein n=1 Tax=Psilocybe cf. subviscida TaxID=2480587 RepID=A0A8H5B0M7_9AGAR|nr:hypothetical protein D9619_011741 [Psilocybe cf. subviscida]